jgi:hypothetical protein
MALARGAFGAKVGGFVGFSTPVLLLYLHRTLLPVLTNSPDVPDLLFFGLLFPEKKGTSMKTICIFFLLIVCPLAMADDVLFLNGHSIANCSVVDTTSGKITVMTTDGTTQLSIDSVRSVVKKPFDTKSVTKYYKGETEVSLTEFKGEPPPLQRDNWVLVKLLDGRNIEGVYLSSTESTATYRTSNDTVVLSKSLILSAQLISNTQSSKKVSPKMVPVKEYDRLPLLILTVAGGVGAAFLFKDASDYSDAADALRSLRLTKLADEAESTSSERLWFGIGASVVSIVFLVLAVTPTTHYIEQPVTIIPTSNGVRLAIRF